MWRTQAVCSLACRAAAIARQGLYCVCAGTTEPLSLLACRCWHACISRASLQDRVKGRVARALAVCHLGLGQLSQSLSYCGIAGAPCVRHAMQ
jgi:hypothetical protein